MAKSSEKMLYNLYLDLWYAANGYDDRIEDLTIELKDAKASGKKAKKLLADVEAQYTTLTGSAPRKPK